MTPQIAGTLALTALAAVALTSDRIRPDVTALALLVALTATGLLSPATAFQGFGSETVILILGLLILTAALSRTGVVELVGSRLLRLTGTSPWRIQLVTMCTACVLSAFMSNTAATAFLVPVALGLASRARIGPRPVLLPVAFASILSSSVTLVSTSTNVVVSGLLVGAGERPMGMFELAPLGIPIALVGLLYMLFVARVWLRSNPGEVVPAPGDLRAYLSEIVVLPDSNLVGSSLGELDLGETMDLLVVRIVRGGGQLLAPQAPTVIRAGDVLLVEASPDQLLRVKDAAGIEIKADHKLADPTLPIESLGIVEAILLARSPLIGQTLKGVRYRERHGVQVLGVSRHGGRLARKKISVLPLRVGDILMVQGPRADLAALEEAGHFRVIQALSPLGPARARAGLAIALFVGALALATANVLPLSVAVLGAAVLAFLTDCITPEQAYRELEWSAVILIGSMLALGAAMEQTGTARYLAGLIAEFVGDLGPRWLLAAFFVLTVALTQVMSNQAAAVVVLPVALETAHRLGLAGRPFAMLVAVAASCSYLTPLEPSCLMVYGPGGYRFSDFPRYGGVLTVLIGLMAVAGVPWLWPLVPVSG